MRFAQAVIPNSPVIIKLRREEESLDNIKQFYIDCQDKEDKFRALSNIYGTISIGQSMIFCDVSNCKCPNSPPPPHTHTTIKALRN